MKNLSYITEKYGPSAGAKPIPVPDGYFGYIPSTKNSSPLSKRSDNITASPIYFCKKCSDNTGNTKTGGECDSVIDNGGRCLKYDFKKMADDINVLDKFGDRREVEPGVLKSVNGQLILKGESRKTDGKRVEYKLKKECNGSNCEWMFYDEDKPEGGEGWVPMSEYLTGSLHENRIIMKEDMNRIPQMIDDKLREFNFYTVDPKKGKQKISFTDDDREVIVNNYGDMLENYPEDIAFIRSVVSCRDIDDKTNEPFVRLGSYRDSSNINLPFSKKVNGLEKVLDGGINYFTIMNNPGPDNRDFKIVPGDRIKDVDFDEETKEMMSKPEPEPQQPMRKEEPFEEVMKNKERKGLASLMDKGELSNDFTKSQKKIIEKLKREGYLFKQPVDEGGYEMKEVKSKEFTESFKVWKKKS